MPTPVRFALCGLAILVFWGALSELRLLDYDLCVAGCAISAGVWVFVAGVAVSRAPQDDL